MTSSDELLAEHRCLVERGVRSLALTGSCRPEEVGSALHRLAVAADGRVVPFVLAEGKLCGFAANAWVVDLLAWAADCPRIQFDRIAGVLLGYSPEAIARFEELGSTLGPHSAGGGSDGPV